ncbi:hypothetical protein WMY93_027537 [Mugilogobius chulae]|uniref:Microtubule-associated protein 1B n=1 Tax=Mugilogobius chulae TaxID=88201 RepID=A0AAW0MZZ5_9GOBI
METLYAPSNTAQTPPCPAQHFNDSKFYLLVVIGEVVTEEHLKCAIADIERDELHNNSLLLGFRQRILHHKSNILETVVLINPSDEAVSTEVRLMISDTSRHKLLVLSGQCSENTGELILQSGSFSFYNFIDIFTDQEIGELLSTIHPANKANLTLSCPDQGDWKNSNLDKHNLQDFINMKLNSVLILPEMEGLSEFTEYLFESVEIPAPFDLLEPPTSGGFLKLSKPCCYIFPGGQGDSALFAVNGFNMLINGGSDRKSCFWKLVRHLDRVDSILLTHIGDDNLPGINSMLQRKMAEIEEEQSQGSTANSDWTNNMISPDIGVVFVNLPENLSSTEPNARMRRTLDEISVTQQLLAKLNLRVEPLQRPIGNIIEPVILFQKMGVGKLEMYVLNPAKNSKEMQHFMKHWKGTEKDTASILLPNGKESEYPVSYLTSISSLIVWHPANPSDKVVRVLFPGNATQQQILEGLEKLKHLDFLKQSIVTQKGMASSVPSTPTLKQTKMKHRADSKESLKSSAKPSPVKTGRKESKRKLQRKPKQTWNHLMKKQKDYEEKGCIGEVEPQKEESNDQKVAAIQDEHHEYPKEKGEIFEDGNDVINKNVDVLHIEVEEVKAAPQVSHKVSSPISPAASINHDIVPVGFENSASDEEERDEQAEDFTVASGLTQSTIEISSVPTPLDDMSTPKDLMSDETANDDSPTQDVGNLETSQSEEVHKNKLSPIQSEPEYNKSHSDATEGHDYNVSASTVSPCSLLEDDKFVKDFEKKVDSCVSMQVSGEQDNKRPDEAHSPLSPFIRSPSVEIKQIKVESPSNFAAPIELSTTLTKTSPDDKPVEGPSSPQSSGHTPYYQSPVDEKAGSLPLVDEWERCRVQLLRKSLVILRISRAKYNILIGQKKNGDHTSCAFASSICRHETDNNNSTTFKEESKMSISEGTTSDKSGTPLEEVPTTDSPSCHAEVGSPHSTEVDDSLSVSVVQTPTTFHEAECSPTKEDSPRPMSISPDISPKTKIQAHMDTRSPEHSTMSAEFGQESPDHSLALDFSKQSPEHPSLGSGSHATENGPTEIDYSPLDKKDTKSSEEKPVLFEECDARATSATPSDASQSTPSVTTPCLFADLTQEAEKTDRSIDVPKTASTNISYEATSLSEDPLPKDNLTLSSPSAEIVEQRSQEKEKSPTPENVSSLPKFESTTLENHPPAKQLETTSPSIPKIPSPTSLPLKSDTSFCNVPCGSKDPANSRQSSCGASKTDVDLCLVSSCEYRHPKTELSPSFMNPNPLEYFISGEGAIEEEKPLTKSGGGSRPPGGKQSSKQCEETPPTSISESAPSQTDSDVPPGTEECPSITADANIDSEDDSETLPTDRTLTYRHADPPPTALKDSAPSPGQHDVCMVDPEALKAEENANTDGEKPKKKKLSKKPAPVGKPAAPKSKDTKTVLHKKSLGEGKDAKNATNTSASRGVKSATGNGKGSSGTALLNCPPMYMDLVYIPNHCSVVRSSYYVISGNNPSAQEPSKTVLDALLEGKSHWEHNMQVTLIPTHDTDVLREWYQETHDKQQN